MAVSQRNGIDLSAVSAINGISAISEINGIAASFGEDLTAPELVSATIGADGETLTLVFTENVAFGAGGNGGFAIDPSGGAATLTYASGSGSTTLIYDISRVIESDETATLDYTQPGDGVEDTSPNDNDLATFTNEPVTNDSEQGGGLTTGLVAYWKMDQASGNEPDEIGTNDLVDNNTVTADTGVLNGAREFTNANAEYFTCADHADLRFGGDWTLSVWVNFNSFPEQMVLVSKFGSASGQREFELSWDGGARFRARLSDNADNEAFVQSATSPSSATWYHVVCKVDGNTMSIIVNDGTPDTVDVSGLGTTSSTTALHVGTTAFLPGVIRNLDGILDEIGKWNRALSASEITTLYGSGTPPTLP